MKARVKATGEIVDIEKIILRGREYYINMTGEKIGFLYMKYELDFGFDCDYDSDYWTRLEHQAAIAAMQGILSNPESELDYKGDETLPQALAKCAAKVAHALVEKLKEKEEK